jgi:hypothetical protein
VHDRGELGLAYDRAGERPVMLQSVVEGATRFRCIHAAGEVVWPGGAAPPHAGDRIAADARRLAQAIGLQIWSFELCLRAGEPIWLSGPDPWPALEPAELGAEAFDRVVEAVLALLLRAGRKGQ